MKTTCKNEKSIRKKHTHRKYDNYSNEIPEMSKLQEKIMKFREVTTP